MNEHQKHLYRLLVQAGEALRAFQLYEMGRGNGQVATAVNINVTQALVRVFEAQRSMERVGLAQSRLMEGNTRG